MDPGALRRESSPAGRRRPRRSPCSIPACGSGHFLTEALAILAALRQAEEHVSSSDAVATVLRDNLHGLEIDGRCVQIAAFAVALTAWRIGGWQALPLPRIAWVGAPPPLPKREFVALADGDPELEYALAAFHDLFERAPLLGSLLEPSGSDLFEAAKMRETQRLLIDLLSKTRRAEPEIVEGAISARGMSDAASVLYSKFTLIATNPPYLGQGEFSRDLYLYISNRFKKGKSDISTAFIERMANFAHPKGSIASVTKARVVFFANFLQISRRNVAKS